MIRLFKWDGKGPRGLVPAGLSPTVEDAADKMRQMAMDAIAMHESRDQTTEISLVIGRIPGTGVVSLPRPGRAGVPIDATAMTAILDRALRLMAHPSLGNFNLDAEQDPTRLMVTDAGGNLFEVRVTQVSRE
jgi:hypothetical protein